MGSCGWFHPHLAPLGALSTPQLTIRAVERELFLIEIGYNAWADARAYSRHSFSSPAIE